MTWRSGDREGPRCTSRRDRNRGHRTVRRPLTRRRLGRPSDDVHHWRPEPRARDPPTDGRRPPPFKEIHVLAQLRNARQSESGFTLIELLMVIVILGVLAGVVVFAVGGITDKGQTSACKADYKTMQVAEEAYYAQNGSYAAEAALVTAK